MNVYTTQPAAPTTTNNKGAQILLSPTVPFPPLNWWRQALACQNVVIDTGEHYQKMSYRNRYYVASAQGKMLLSLALANGRNQRIASNQVRIAYNEPWQQQHWRTLVSLYQRSPYFEFFEHYFEPMFQQQYEYLHEWNMVGIQQIIKILKLPITLTETKVYQKHYSEEYIDIRNDFKPSPKKEWHHPEYYQVFKDRIGFVPDCSILDLIFCEGMQTKTILQQQG
jgi:hypothetical protein